MKQTSLFHLPHRAAPHRRPASLVILLLALASAREAAALPLAHEGFQYFPAQPLPTMVGGFGWAPGPWTGSSQMVDTPPTLSYPSALPSSGDALFNPAAGEAWRYFGWPFNNAGNDLWFSFQQETAAPGSGAFVDILPLSGGDIRVNKDAAGNITLNGVPAGISAGVGKVDFFLVQVVQFNGFLTVVNLYLDPGAALGPPSATFSTTMVFQANEFYFRTDPGQWLDEIWVGTTPQDVSEAASQGANGASGAQFFRVVGPSATTITSFGADGTLVFSNAIVGGTYTIQTASSLVGVSPPGGGPGAITWLNDHQVVASNNVVTDSELVALLNPFFWMADIPGGTFVMGDTLDGEADATPTEITVSEYYMDRTLVPYSLWRSVYTWATSHGYGAGFANNGVGKKANHPVQALDWYDCVKWCNARSEHDALTPVYYLDAGLTQVYRTGEQTPYVNWSANGYRLPTEAEWERAARGGLSGQRFPLGMDVSDHDANYFSDPTHYFYDFGPGGFNSVGTSGGLPYTTDVYHFAPNGYGLYDMAGNVEEWCWDRYGTPYGQPSTTNPTGPVAGTDRVNRGGGWNQPAPWAKCAFRSHYMPALPSEGVLYLDTGFRCVRGH